MPEETEEPESLFPLIGNLERPVIEQIIQAVRGLFRRKDITAEQMHHLAVLLFGLERLPAATPGLDVTLILSDRYETEMHYHSVDLDSETLSLTAGGSAYDPNSGSDSFSDEVLMVETSGFRDANERGIVQWLLGFKERVPAGEIKVDLDDTCDVDWGAEPDESAWERAAQDYGADGQPADN